MATHGQMLSEVQDIDIHMTLQIGGLVVGLRSSPPKFICLETPAADRSAIEQEKEILSKTDV